MLLGCIAWPCAPGHAHGPMHEQIERWSRHIEREPGDGSLYVMRAKLYRAHADFEAALADLDRAAKLDPGIAELAREKGRTLLEAGKPGAALVFLERAIAQRGDDVAARLARARALVLAARYDTAAAEYDEVLARTTRRLPEHYIERADALARQAQACSDIAMRTRWIERAVRGLDEARSRHGFLVVLEQRAVELERSVHHHEAALTRIDRIISNSPRTEKWQAMRGDILRDAGHPARARDAYRDALTAIAGLPAARRATPAIGELAGKIRTSLELLETEK